MSGYAKWGDVKARGQETDPRTSEEQAARTGLSGSAGGDQASPARPRPNPRGWRDARGHRGS